MTTVSCPIIEHIVEQHAEEAAFLWTLRDAATNAPNYKRHHLARLDERVEAHVDGLRVAGEAGWRIALAQLDRRCEHGELFAASILALESGYKGRIEKLTARAAGAERQIQRGLIGAVAWCPPTLLAATVRRWTSSEDAFERYLALCACSVHRAHSGPSLQARLSDADERVRARALRLAGELGRSDLLEPCLDHLEDSDEPSLWAAWSCVLVGDRGSALASLETRALTDDPHRWAALEVAIRAFGIERGRSLIQRLNTLPVGRLSAVVGAGHLGDPVAVPWLIKQMDAEDLARAAGSSFSLITGTDLARHDLDRVVASDDGEESDLSHLPMPDPVLVARWWDRAESRPVEGKRHLLGAMIDRNGCAKAWQEAYQGQRRQAALELALMKPDEPLLNWSEKCLKGKLQSAPGHVGPGDKVPR